MDVVIDSNVIFRMLISGGEIIKLFFDSRLKIFAPERLREDEFHISLLTQRMSDFRNSLISIPPNKDSCVHPVYGECAYFNNHILNEDVGNGRLIKIDPLEYLGMKDNE